jgi:hypothetical protein
MTFIVQLCFLVSSIFVNIDIHNNSNGNSNKEVDFLCHVKMNMKLLMLSRDLDRPYQFLGAHLCPFDFCLLETLSIQILQYDGNHSLALVNIHVSCTSFQAQNKS